MVLLHGAALLDTFAKQYALADCFHLIVPHLPGAGKAAAERYEPVETVHAIAELILSLCGRAAVVGHSLGAELALALTCQCEPLIVRAAFLSPWVCSTKRTVRRYARLAKTEAMLLRCGPLVRMNARYLGLSKPQGDYLAAYAREIRPETYAGFFEKRIHLSEQQRYPYIDIPMLALCGALETKEIRSSVKALSERNPRCEMRMLRGAAHDYPLRQSEKLNPILVDFLTNAF